jgi:hypothetical protein
MAMQHAALATNLLGRRVRLHQKPDGAPTATGEIATVYLDERGLHYVLLLGGRLVRAEDEGQFTVLPEEEW